MANFAVIEENTITNIIIAENKDIAESVVQKTCIECTESLGYAQVGGTYDPIANKFIGIKPFESWNFNTETWTWNSPVAYPTDGLNYYWNEDLTSWELSE
jgi:hypothetical protein